MSRSDAEAGAGERRVWAAVGGHVAGMLFKAPIHNYRWTLKP